MFKKIRHLTLLATVVGAMALSFAGAASAECTIFQNPGYAGKAGVVQNNDYVRFSGNAPARKNRTFDDHWWHNRVTGVKVTPNCKAVFFGSHGSKFTHFVITESTPAMPRGQNDLTQGIICECT